MPRTQLNVRVPDSTFREIDKLMADYGYESQSHVVLTAVTRLYQQEKQPMTPATRIDTIRVNFGFALLQRLSGWTDEKLEEKEGELDFFLDQEMGNEFSEAGELHGTAFYAQDKDYLVEAYSVDGDEFAVNTVRLEKVARAAVECIKQSE